MPNLGDTKYGFEIGKPLKQKPSGRWENYDKYVWWECPDCKRQYWKREYDINRSATKGLCIRCCRKGDRSYRWGQSIGCKSEGYTLIVLRADDPFFSMATQARTENYGYIREHRLVMARKLGRCLKSSEVVHHLNGIRDDNREENLALVTNKSHPRWTFIKQLQKRIRDLEQLHLGI